MFNYIYNFDFPCNAMHYFTMNIIEGLKWDVSLLIKLMFSHKIMK